MPAVPVFHSVVVSTHLKITIFCQFALSYSCSKVHNWVEVSAEKDKILTCGLCYFVCLL